MIPLGPDGITYLHFGMPEMQPVGPAALVVSETGSFVVLDTGGRGVVISEPDGLTRLSLDWPGIKSLIDISIGPAGLRILDLHGTTLQARVAEVDWDGYLERIVDLPGGLQLQAGLSGIATGPAGELWVELEGAARVAVVPEFGEVKKHAGYPYPSGLYTQLPGEPYAESITYQAGEVQVQIVTDEGSSVGAKLLGTNPDASFVLEVTESSQDEDFVIRVTMTAHWYEQDGTLLAVAPLPLGDQEIYVNKPAALGPDGQIYYLLTRKDDVAILRLPWTASP
jgi:hypothetical protein